MSETANLLKSKCIIDGIEQQLTLEQMLKEACLEYPEEYECGVASTLFDERQDPELDIISYCDDKIDEYSKLVSVKECSLSNTSTEKNETEFEFSDAESFTKLIIARELTRILWLNGHFKLSDIGISPIWKWNIKPIGNVAALYSSVASLIEFADDHDIDINTFKLQCLDNTLPNQNSSLIIETSLSQNDVYNDEKFLINLPNRTIHPHLENSKKSPKLAKDKENSWLIYMPFSFSEFNMGGSLLSKKIGQHYELEPELNDFEYFLSCFEVARELIEDGIIHAGTYITDGGLMNSLKEVIGNNFNIEPNLRDIMSAYGEDSIAKILFSESPGIVFQIYDSDYDYVDAELTLQDVAYYPLCQLSNYQKNNGGKVSPICEDNSIMTILNSLIEGKSKWHAEW